MYVKYKNYLDGAKLNEGDMILMSHDEFINGGKDIENIPIAVTPDGSEPQEPEEDFEIGGDI